MRRGQVAPCRPARHAASTYTFIALVVPLAAVTRGQPGSRRALWAAALAMFAVSALHLSQLHQGDASWPVELVGHHASLPLAFAILYQDYPFALADLFLKRALTLLAIVALAFAAIADVRRRFDRLRPIRRARPAAGRHPGHAVGGARRCCIPACAASSPGSSTRSSCAGRTTRALRAAIARTAQAHDDVHDAARRVCAGSSPRR